MTTKLMFGRDNQGYNAYAPQFSTNHFSATLVNGAEETFTIPSNFPVWVISFSYQPGSTVWVATNTTAAIPAGAAFASTNSELNPGARLVYAGDIIHCITSNASSDVGISLYSVDGGI